MNLQIDPAELRPLIEAVVTETLAAIRENSVLIDGERLSYSEAEAAALLGVRRHVLAAARRGGEITASKAGGRFCYEASELRDYLFRNRQR